MTTEKSLQEIVDTLSQSNETTISVEKNLQEIVEVLSRPDETPWWDIAASIAGIAGTIIAIVAIFMTVYTVRAQNKQNLFEKRLEVYLLCKTFYDLINDNQKVLDIKSEHGYPINVDLEFIWITNTDFFNGSPKLIFDLHNEDFRYGFLQKLEELGIVAEKCSLLFERKDGEKLRIFIESYRNALRSMYSYQIVLNKMQNDPTNEILKDTYEPGKSIMMPKDAKQLCKEYGEAKHRKRVLDDIANLKKSFLILKRDHVLEKIKRKLI